MNAATPATSSSHSSSSTANLPYIERYRPSSLSEVVAHEEIIDTLRRFVSQNALPHLLFHGPAGTGKTTTITAVAREMYPEPKQYAANVRELNASDERGIAVVQTQIKSFVQTQSLGNVFRAIGSAAERAGPKPPKLVILDEADHMTSSAQFALRRMIEQYHRHARFILICNFVARVIPALQSRCTTFRFSPLSKPNVRAMLERVCAAEKIRLRDCGFEALSELAGGDMRCGLNLLQGAAMLAASREGGPLAATAVTGDSRRGVAVLNDDDTAAKDAQARAAKRSRAGAAADDAAGDIVVVSGAHVLESAGHPLPEEMDALWKLLWDSKSGTFETLTELVTRYTEHRGYDLTAIVNRLHQRVSQADVPEKARQMLVIALGDVQYRLSLGVDATPQAVATIAPFIVARSTHAVKAAEVATWAAAAAAGAPVA